MKDKLKPALDRLLHLVKGSGEAIPEPDLADLRVAIRAAVRRRIDFSGDRYLFPARGITVEIFASDTMDRAALQRLFCEEGVLERDVRALLEGEDCEYPPDLQVTVELSSTPLAGGEPFRISYEVPESPGALPDEPPAAAEPPSPENALLLEVTAGTANTQRLPLGRKVTNLGRLAAIYRAGRFERQNDLAFLDETNGVNETVARQHAHILWTGDSYRLFDSGGSTGKTLVIRDGRPFRATASGPGIRLQPGDEIHLGAARLKVMALPPEEQA